MATTKPKANTVLGTITDANKRPLSNLKVEIYDVDMRSWQPLADTVTDKNGKYELHWQHSQLSGRGKKAADIAVKVLTSVKGTELYKSEMDGVRFNAGEREEINIMLTKDVPAEDIEFDKLVDDVKFLADKVAIEDLQESKEHKDITFLSKELEVPAEKLEHLVVAHRLQKLSKADAEFFYTLFRKNTLLLDDFAKQLKARHSITIGEDDNTLLYDAALTDAAKIKADIKAAVKERVVASSAIKNVNQNLEILAGFKKEAEAFYENEHPRKVIEQVTKMLNPEKMQEVKQLFDENKNDLNSFFEKVSDPAFYETKEKTQAKGLNDALDTLFGFGKAAIPNIVKGNKIKKVTDVKKLARLNKKMWVEEIKKANPQIKRNKAISTYASAVVRRFEKTFPTIAFAAQLERSAKPVLKKQKEIVRFFKDHEDFELLKNNVDLYFKENKVSKKDSEAIGDELKSVQRVFKLIPHYGKTLALREEKMHSAFNIVSAGKTRFEKEIAPKAGLTPIEAKEVFRKAEAKHTAAILMIGDLNDSMSAMSIASLENPSLVTKLEAVSKDFPNLKSLFKLTDTCECEHCRSVYSPAAYLVEILQFLDKRTVVAGNAKSELFSRRPDLGEIDLGCENANTPVKYIDLVCEILEETIAPDQGIDYTGNLTDGADPSKGKIAAALLSALLAEGLPVTEKALIHETEAGMTSPSALPHYLRDTKVVCKIVNTGGNDYKVYRLRQTLSSAAELDAAPEYVNALAYDALLNADYAFKLPFDLPHTEAKAYFDRFNIDRAELMKSFQLGTGPTDEEIATEDIGLTDSERKLITNTPLPNDNAAQQAFWHVPVPGNAVDYLKRVDHFLDRTSLQYKDLELLLKLKFIKKNGDLFIFHNDLTCDTATKEIKNLSLTVLDRMHRYLRLQKKLQWRFETLDEVISQPSLGNGNLNPNSIKIISDLKKVSEKTGLKIEELICCYGEIPHLLLPYQTTTLYDSIFQNKAKNGSIERGLASENVTDNESAAVKIPLTDFKSGISTSINVKEIDFEKLVAALPNIDLSFVNLSALYATGKLIKKLKIKTDDFFILKGLTGIDVFNSPADTIKFCEAVEKTRFGSMNLADVKFMLQHKADNLSDREIKSEKIGSVLKELQAAYQKSFNDNRSTYNNTLSAEAQKEALKTQLSKLPVLAEGDVNIIMNFIDRNWKYAWVDNNFIAHNGTNIADAITFIDDKNIASLFDVTSIKAALNTLAGAAGPDIESEQKMLIKSWLDAITVYLYKSEKPAILNSSISSAFKASPDTVAIVLSNAMLKKLAPGTDVVRDVLQSDTLIDTAAINTGHPLPVLPPITEATFPKQYAALRLLHKLFPLINSLKADNTQSVWFLKNNKSVGPVPS